MNSNEKMTSKMIAKELGVSTATIDRVLNNRGNVKKATYEMVMKKIKELNFIPNKSASFLSKKIQMTVAVVFPVYPQYFWRQIESGVKKAYDELKDFGLKVKMYRPASTNVHENTKMIKDIIDAGEVDALILCADDSHAMTDLIDYGIKLRLPISTFNTDSLPSNRVFHVGSELREAGRLAADLLCKMMGKKGKITMILEREDYYQFQQKIIGFREAVMEYPDVEIVGPLKLDHMDLDNTWDKISKEISEVDGIYVAIGELGNIAGFIKSMDAHSRPVLIGHDMNEAIYQFLQEDIISATICQDPVNQGYLAIRFMFQHLCGNKIKELNITKLEIVTRVNAKYYM
ncbi:LacI family DNA-binding transcriptional regulator [Cohnella silvisoli]|uniref:LacI family DNA-binding transcriptional regulator n=1 Tax=Cohnella silvisoli TaxID=2873699 RepID=A0ABV1L326_9BACL|nr:LacI family DNA-binding transcriptional regulator [Cohnella silvisoli]MCD9025393.1 LacI family DNA-binding transcriptional regulator [Cohnella silvisoli]